MKRNKEKLIIYHEEELHQKTFFVSDLFSYFPVIKGFVFCEFKAMQLLILLSV